MFHRIPRALDFSTSGVRDWRRSIRVVAACLAAGAVACASGTGLTREDALAQVSEIGALDGRLTDAKLEGLDLLAPRGFEAARQSLDEAVASAQNGETAEAQQRAQAGLERLEQASQESERSAEALRDVLERRGRAVAAGAPELLPERFEELDQRLRAAARLAERGEIDGAKDAGTKLLEGYSSIELDSLKVDATELARKAISDAREAGADRYAKETFKRAEQELSLANGILETDRSEVARANVHARRAAQLAARSQHAGEIVKEFDRRDYDSEAIVLWYQDQVQTLMTPLGDELSFTSSNHEVISTARGRIAATERARAEAVEELADARKQIEDLELSSTLSAADQREAEARYDRIQAMFTDDEAAVYRQGQNVRLETYGFDFPVGQSEIQSSNFPLLKKIATAIREFSFPEVVVSGHTDSSGNDALNQKLSEERAQKVADFLVEVSGFDRKRVTAKGFGESRPVASEATAAGRARNRRIEILIINR